MAVIGAEVKIYIFPGKVPLVTGPFKSHDAFCTGYMDPENRLPCQQESDNYRVVEWTHFQSYELAYMIFLMMER